jgi:hypothetical protein
VHILTQFFERSPVNFEVDTYPGFKFVVIMSSLRSANLYVIALYVLVNAAVVIAQGNPPCYFCDGDPTATLSNPNGMVPIPPELAGNTGLTEISCSNLLAAGINGFIPVGACATATASDELKKGCGCSNYVAAPVAAPVATPAPLPTAPVGLPSPLPTTPVSGPVASPFTEFPTSEPVSPTTNEPTDATTPTTSKGSMGSKEGKKEPKTPKEGRDKGAKTPKEPKAKMQPKSVKLAPEDKVPKQPKRLR